MRLMIRQEAWRVFLLLQFFFLLLLTNVIRLRVCALLSSAACETPLTAAARLVPEHQFSVVNFPEKFRFRRVAQRIRRQGHHSHSCATTGSRLATAVHNNTTSPQPPLLLLPPLRHSRNNLTTGERRQKQCSRQALRSKFNHVGSRQVEEKAE